MKIRNLIVICVLLTVIAAVSVSCKGKKAEMKPIKGVLEEPVKEGAASEMVNATLDRHVLDSNFENLLLDTVNKVAVWSLVRCDSVTSSDGFGIVVAKESRATIFANICHGNNPTARYDAVANCLWLTGVSMEGTGVHVERLYQIKFPENGPANIAASLDPFEMQQALCGKLNYSVDGEKITLYFGENEPFTVTNTVKDMGGFFDDALWLGEQLSYDISGDNIYVHATPGVSFVTGKVLHYDDMPTLSAQVLVNDGGNFTLSELKIMN